MRLLKRHLIWLLVVVATGCSVPAKNAKPLSSSPEAIQAQIQPTQLPQQAPPSPPTQPVQPPPVAPPPPAPPAEAQPSPPRPAPSPPAAPAPAPARPSAQGRFVVLNFDNADVEVVIHAASEIVGFNYVLGPDVRGKVTVQTSSRIPQEEVFNVLLAILEVHGLTAVKSENLYKIVRIAAARERPVPTVVGSEADPQRTGDEIITQIIPLRFASVVEVSNILRPLISREGNLIAHRETNLLIITDSASNIRRLIQILGHLDVETTLNELQILPIKFADAAEIANILNQLFAAGRLRPAQGPAVPVPTPAPAAPGAPPAPRAAAPEVSGGPERPPLIIAERRSNSIIVHARKPEMELIRKLIGQLDVDVYGGKRVFVYYAENAKAKDLAATLNAIYSGRETQPRPTTPQPTPGPGQPPTTPPPAPRTPPRAEGASEAAEIGLAEGEVRFVADETTNALIVTTFPRNWTQIEETIKKLDRMPKQVLIEVTVAEITLSDDLSLGIEWALKNGASIHVGDQIFRIDGSQSSSSSLTGRPGFTSSFPGPATATATLGTLPGLTLFAASETIMQLVNALAKDNRLTILSSPSILTSENKKATINVSNSVPIITSSTVPTAGAAGVATQTVEYKDAGIVLTVTPRIGEKRSVALDIKQEVNDVGDPQPPSNSPIIIKREADTSVVIADGQTLVLGGLIQTKRGITRTGIPFLNRIPVLGLLFGATSNTFKKTELMILITPRVVANIEEGRALTNQIRQRTPDVERSLEESSKPPLAQPATPSK